MGVWRQEHQQQPKLGDDSSSQQAGDAACCTPAAGDMAVRKGALYCVTARYSAQHVQNQLESRKPKFTLPEPAKRRAEALRQQEDEPPSPEA
ncbi:hypothetical protein COO60DRAFT_1706841, partial [Scenedesmus sp. NREL 46B-D3]